MHHPSAAEGTRGHLYLEMVLGGLYLDRQFLTSDLPPLQRRTREAVDKALHVINQLIKAGCEVVAVEDKVYASDDVWGTMDLLLYDTRNNMFMVLDYKNGVYPVHAEDNLQLQCYAWGAWLKYKHRYPPMERICYGIIQPNSSDHQYFTNDIKYLSQLFDFSVYMMECVEVAKGRNAPIRAGEWCHWCNAKTKCLTYQISERDVLRTHHALSPQEAKSIDQLMKTYGNRHHYKLFAKKSRTI